MTTKYSALENKDKHIPLVLKIDRAGNPIKWMLWKSAVAMDLTGRVAYKFGTPFSIRTGSSGLNKTDVFDLYPVMACGDRSVKIHGMVAPPLNNKELFRRDRNLCQYCGRFFPHKNDLSRDHIHPTSKGGLDTWTNCVTACLSCNHRKGAKSLERAGMQLIAVPYEPNSSEILLLQNRRIVADQQEFLLARATDNYKSRLGLN